MLCCIQKLILTGIYKNSMSLDEWWVLKTLSSQRNRAECYIMNATEQILTQVKKYDIVKTD